MMHATLGWRPSPLSRALRRAAAVAGIAITIIEESERPWAAATFTGTRWRIVLSRDPSPAFAVWLASLPTAEFDVHGAIIADLSIEDQATIVALVLDADE